MQVCTLSGCYSSRGGWTIRVTKGDYSQLLLYYTLSWAVAYILAPHSLCPNVVLSMCILLSPGRLLEQTQLGPLTNLLGTLRIFARRDEKEKHTKVCIKPPCSPVHPPFDKVHPAGCVDHSLRLVNLFLVLIFIPSINLSFFLQQFRFEDLFTVTYILFK